MEGSGSAQRGGGTPFTLPITPSLPARLNLTSFQSMHGEKAVTAWPLPVTQVEEVGEVRVGEWVEMQLGRR